MTTRIILTFVIALLSTMLINGQSNRFARGAKGTRGAKVARGNGNEKSPANHEHTIDCISWSQNGNNNNFKNNCQARKEIKFIIPGSVNQPITLKPGESQTRQFEPGNYNIQLLKASDDNNLPLPNSLNEWMAFYKRTADIKRGETLHP